MDVYKPILTIIAGCNGSGKSSFANALSPKGTPSFDYDKVYLEKYRSLPDSEQRDVMAHNMARTELEASVKRSIKSNVNFTYETNFNTHPLYWPEKFKAAGFKIRLVYFCLDSVDEAMRRVQIRVENGGHFVPQNEITERYYAGYKNLNTFWEFFEEIYLFDTSPHNQTPTFLFAIIDKRVEDFVEYPSFLKKLVPSIKT